MTTGTSSLCQLKSSPDDLCVISIGFKLWIEITVEAYQFGNPLLYLIPIQPDMRLIVPNAF